MLTLILVMALLLAIALLHGYVESFRRGPSHCAAARICGILPPRTFSLHGMRQMRP